MKGSLLLAEATGEFDPLGTGLVFLMMVGSAYLAWDFHDSVMMLHQLIALVFGVFAIIFAAAFLLNLAAAVGVL